MYWNAVRMPSSSALRAAVFIGSGLAAACSDSPTDPADELGAIEVVTLTTGDDLDPTYVLNFQTQSLELSSTDTLLLAELAPGDYSVTLSSVADNCAVSGDNPRTVTVAASQTVTATFNVACTALAGALTLMAADRAGDIYTIDETTGTETLWLDTSMDDGTGTMVDLGVVSAMHYIPSTEKWWLGTGGRGVCSGCILTLDLSTLDVTELTDAPRGVSGLAVHPTTEKIYTFESDGTSEIYEIDATTGGYTLLFGSLGMKNGGTGTTFSVDEALYVAARDELWTVDLGTGTPTLVGAMTYTGFPAFTETSQTIGSMATRASDGVVFGILKDGGHSGTLNNTFLVTINLSTAEVTNVGPHTHMMDGLMYMPTALITG